MSDSSGAIRADIERTQDELGMDVDALADKVNPSKIVDRQVNKMRGAFGAMRERVMGAADDAGETASDLADGAKNLGKRVEQKAAGAPLAVGLIAFGFGLLIAGLIPSSEKEKKWAEEVKDRAQPLVDEATQVAKDIGEDLKEPAQDAADAVKDRATRAVDNVKAESTDAAQDVKGDAQRAGDQLGSD